ncbi:MAG: Ig-like domain-containing protein, partial [Gammaproteobacteria bacterium]|nr:Ig-like domain-containing protein [Gammaproteobacteria bacterium]
MMPRYGRVRSALPLIVVGAATFAAACGGGDTVDPGPAPPPPPPVNRAPVPTTAIQDQMVVEGQTVTIDISASFSDPDGDALSHTAATSNAGVATVAVSGTELSVTGVAQGAAAVTVTASDPGGLSASQSFAVEVAAPAPTILTVAPESSTLTAIDQTIQLYADVRDQLGRPITDATVVWSSGDTTVAMVDTSGLVTAAANGSATVTARAGEASDSASIVVLQTATAVEITPEINTIATGDTVRLVATASDDNGHVVDDAAFRWSSSDTAVASVGSLGLVLGVAEGTATITAAIGAAAAQVEGLAQITVLPPPPPPDLTGTYFLESLVGTSTGGTLLTRPTVSGTLELTQEAPVGDA